MSTIENDGKKKILFLGTVIISGDITCETGLHIGDSDDSIKIGGIDKFVIKDPATKKPYIPGSSLKGKKRSLLEKSLGKPANRKSDKVYRYETDNINDAITDEVCRIFGFSTQTKDLLNFPSRLIVRDCIVDGELNQRYFLEVKSENTLDRISGHAVPRTNERVAKGTKFILDMEYTVEVILDDNNNNKILLGNKSDKDYWTILIEDLHTILDILALIEHSYIGGNGSRGYGKVVFTPSLEGKTRDELLGKTSTVDILKVELNDTSQQYNNNTKFKDERNKIIEIAKKFKGYFEQWKEKNPTVSS